MPFSSAISPPARWSPSSAVTPDEAEAIGEAIFEAGIRIIEVPLNSPEPLKSIELLASGWDRALVGAGTVLDRGRWTT